MKRVKRRYLAVQLDCEGVPDERDLIDAVWCSVTRLYGEVGASLSGLVLISLDVERKVAVVRCNLASLPVVRAGLASVVAVAGKPAALRVLAVSGTLKALFSNLD
jgi:RNase P/RNase MRP subunit POP5